MSAIELLSGDEPNDARELADPVCRRFRRNGGADNAQLRAWLALAAGVTAHDLIATDDEQLTNAARRYFNSQPVATALIILHLIGGLPQWWALFALLFATHRRLELLRV